MEIKRTLERYTSSQYDAPVVYPEQNRARLLDAWPHGINPAAAAKWRHSLPVPSEIREDFAPAFKHLSKDSTTAHQGSLANHMPLHGVEYGMSLAWAWARVAAAPGD